MFVSVLSKDKNSMQLPQCIVIVDDEQSIRSGLSNLLQSEGYSTLTFESAEALLDNETAMAKAALFIIDVELKGISGFQLFSQLTRRLENPPGIIISGKSDEHMLWYAISLGALAFMPKPIDIEALFSHIQTKLCLRDKQL